MLLDDELIDRLHDLNLRAIRLAGETAMRFRQDAALKDIGGGLACFAGEGSPFTQVCEFGHRDPNADVREVEEFYAGRCSNWEVIISPTSSPEALRSVGLAGYLPDHFETHLVMAIETLPDEPDDVEVELITGDTSEWQTTAAQGWAGEGENAGPDEVTQIASSMDGVRCYLARIDGVPAGAASLFIEGGIASMAGASTRVPYRRRGVQTALFARRMRDAGIGKLASIVAVPGSSSYRNALRLGFRPVMTKLVMMRK
jgi:hypothetical protein